MDKNKALLAVVLIGGAALYIMSTRKKCNCKNFTDEGVKELGKEIKAVSEPVEVQSMPDFGRPVNILPPKPKQQPVFQNYIDVQKNEYFKPKAGAFYR